MMKRYLFAFLLVLPFLGQGRIVGGSIACGVVNTNFIGSGCSNLIKGSVNCPSFFSSIDSGYCNVIEQSCWSGIVSGKCNCVKNNESVIGGGTCNSVFSLSSGVFSGCINLVSGSSDFIGGGDRNNIFAGVVPPYTESKNSVIAGGICNTISPNTVTSYSSYTCIGFIGGGCKNSICSGNFAAIGGGSCNLMCGENGFIGGGYCNCVLGAYSAVSGGSCNTVSSSYSYAGVFGCNVIARSNNTFHVECLNAVNTPGTSGTYPSGTIFKCTLGSTLPTGALPLYIMP